jgi:hypothetical protein
MDQTITLTSGEIVINKNLVLSGLGMTHLAISGQNKSRIFHLNPTFSLNVQNITLADANAPRMVVRFLVKVFSH